MRQTKFEGLYILQFLLSLGGVTNWTYNQPPIICARQGASCVVWLLHMSSEQRCMVQIMGGPSGWSYKHSCRVERLEQGTTMSCAVRLA